MRTLSTVLLVLLVVLGLGVAFLYKGDLPAAFVDQKYASEASRFLTTDDGARIHYRDEGEGPAVVLLHGSNASLHTWEPWVETLSRQYRVVTLDLPGHGLTGAVPSGRYGSESQTATINAVVDHLGLETFVLGGNSMGGGATWRYALAHPDRVSAMILVDATGLADWRSTAAESEEETGDTPLAFELLAQPWFRAVARYMDPRMLIEQGLPAAYNNSPVVNEELIDRYYELSLREGTREATMARFGAERPRTYTLEEMATLTQPTLVMWGAQDSLIPVSIAYEFEAILPDTTLAIYDDLGHIPMEEAPARTVQDVLDFLDNLDQREPGRRQTEGGPNAN